MSHTDTFATSFEGLQDLAARLRGPNGCPWDREQTPNSLKHLFLEECYELVEAIEEGDDAKVVEELGDVLFHVVSMVQIAEESGAFSGEDVFAAAISKLVRRHPHVFGDAVVEDSRQLGVRWDQIKREEMKGTDRSILDGVPKAMPSLAYAQAVQGRAARMGFDWDDYDGVVAKVVEELKELETAESDGERELELGDLLFSLVNASRWLGIEAETALRQSNSKFYSRFVKMEKLSRERGQDFEALNLEAKEALWQEAKARP